MALIRRLLLLCLVAFLTFMLIQNVSICTCNPGSTSLTQFQTCHASSHSMSLSSLSASSSFPCASSLPGLFLNAVFVACPSHERKRSTVLPGSKSLTSTSSPLSLFSSTFMEWLLVFLRTRSIYLVFSVLETWFFGGPATKFPFSPWICVGNFFLSLFATMYSFLLVPLFAMPRPSFVADRCANFLPCPFT